MASFTPGPWTANSRIIAVEGSDLTPIDAPERSVAFVPAASIADASLIAAAPDMFALLQAIDDMWSDDGEGCRADPVDARSGKVREIWQQMRDTLAQARGNSI